MRQKHHRLIRPFALTATAAMLAMAVALVWGTGVALAADYQDGNQNVCEGPGCESWGTHVGGLGNDALGNGMMPSLTAGNFNLAVGVRTLVSNTIGTGNIATA
jgi:hypothetical protein